MLFGSSSSSKKAPLSSGNTTLSFIVSRLEFVTFPDTLTIIYSASSTISTPSNLIPGPVINAPLLKTTYATVHKSTKITIIFVKFITLLL